jgi:dTDP-4-amino-4,6-dideoxygalactose transaminase
MVAPVPGLTRTPRPGRSDLLPRLPSLLSPDRFFPDRAVLRTMNGRNAIFLALDALGIRPGATVLLPAYHCTAMIEPVLAYGAIPAYYPVGRDLSVDPVAIARRLSETRAAALIAVHLFGRTAPIRDLRAVCDRLGAALIEDCCHSLFGSLDGVPLGSFGHAAAFSFRKTLAVVDGGALVLPPGAARPGAGPRLYRPWKYQARMAKWALDAARSGAFAPQPLPSASPGAEPAEAPVARRSRAASGPDSQEDPDFLTECVRFPMALVSRWMFRHAQGAAIRRRRRDNYLMLSRLLAGIDGLGLFPDIGPEECPLGLPLLAPPSDQRWDYRLRSRGVPAFSFGEELHASLDRKAFPDAEFLSRNMVILPVHQALGESQLRAMAERARETFGMRWPSGRAGL